MPIQKEIWAADIAEKLFPENSFVMESVDDTAFVDNRKVHLAQAGALPVVVRNRVYTGAPVQSGLRVDTDAEYQIDEYTTNPITIPDIESIEVNYNKRQSVLKGHIDSLNLSVANWMQYHWSASLAANILRTTGTAAPAQVVGATGNRKAVTIDDFLKLKGLFDDMDVDDMNRQALLPSFMLNDFIATNKTLLMNLNLSGDAIFKDGTLRNIFGFNVRTRGKKNILTYTNAALPVVRQPDEAALGAANAAILAWHPSYVRRAKGAVKTFEKLQDPNMYGDVFSALARAGGKKWYDDQTGVAAIIESV
jgi:hypothetical protein